MDGLEEVLAIEKHWKDKDVDQAKESLKIIPGSIIKQLKKIAKVVLFMFENPTDSSVIELKVFQATANSVLTLDQLGSIINQQGKDYMKAGKSYNDMLVDIAEKANKTAENYRGDENKTMKDVIASVFKNGFKDSRNKSKVK